MPRPTKGERTPGSGRKPGTPNRLTGALKDIILQALSNAGGAEYLTRQAEENPTAFLALVGRVLPLQVKDGGAEPRMPVSVIHEHHKGA
jgi:hypothetical protein